LSSSFWWVACGQAELAHVQVDPPDAGVELDEIFGVGAVLMPHDPGPVRVRAWRKGYAPFEGTLQMPAQGELSMQIVLRPLVHAVELSVEPAATLRLTRREEILYEGPAPYVGELLAGPLTVSASAEGYQTEQRALMLDGPLSWSAFLDPEGQIVDKIARFRTAHLPKGLAITADDREIWVAPLGGTGLRVHALQTGEVLADIPLPDAGAVEVLIDDAAGRVYATQMETARVFEVDLHTREILRIFETGSEFTKVPVMSPDKETLYASNWYGGEITEIDLVTGTVRRNMPTLPTPRGLYAFEDAIYVASYGGGGLGRLDLATGETEGVARGSFALRSLVYDPHTRRIYGTDQGRDAIFFYDLEAPSPELVLLTHTDPKPNTLDITPDGRLLLVSNRGADGPGGYLTVGQQRGSMLVVDAYSGEILDAVAGGMQCTALDVSADGRYVAFSDFRDDQIHVYALPPYEVLARGGGGRLPRHAADLLDLDFPGKLDRYD
jgi:DNA-binding beta-propeller fold protein YncE